MTAAARTRMAALAALAVAAVTLGGCNAVSHRATRLDHRAFPIAAGAHTTLSVTTFNGHVNVTAKDNGTADIALAAYATAGSDADAQAALATVTRSLTQSGDNLLVSAQAAGDGPLVSTRGADVDITLPPNADLTLVTSNGRIEAVNVNGRINAQTSNGEVVTRAGHDLQIQTSNASVTMTQPQGSIAVQTSNGAVDILDADGVVADVHSSNAELSFSGSLAAGEHTFRTSNGSLTLHFPPSQGFTLQAATSNADVSGDFSGIAASGSSLAGTTGDASAHVSADTSNGSLTVTRLVP